MSDFSLQEIGKTINTESIKLIEKMRTFVVFGFGILFVVSCSKKEQDQASIEKAYTPAPYDTTAVDSFSQGATSVDIAQKIRMSSKIYQDSLLQVKLKAEEERKKKEEEAKLEKAAKDALEKEKSKAEAKPTTETPTVPAQ